MVVSWIVGAVEYGITALCGVFLFWVLGVTTFDAVFSGFTSPVTWFVFGALLIGQAVIRTGLANRLGYLISQLVGFSYRRLRISTGVTVPFPLATIYTAPFTSERH